MNYSNSIRCWACWIIAVLIVTGCQTSQTSVPSVQRPSVKVDDPCAQRLHDVCGQLLLYHSIHKRLPNDLAELKNLNSATPPLVCPTSGEFYIYNPRGLRISGQLGRLVLYDAIASHSGMRWGILVGDADSRKPLQTRVILLPEDSASWGTNILGP